MKLRETELDTLALAVERNIAKLPRYLIFDRALERRFEGHRKALRKKQTVFAALVGVIVFNVLVFYNLQIAHVVEPSKVLVVYLQTQLIVTVPSLILIFLVGKTNSGRLRELLLILAYAIVTLGAVNINLNISGQPAAYDAFTNVLIPIACSIGLPIAFWSAVIGSVISLAMFSAEVIAHPGMPPEAKDVLVLLYVAVVIITLIANYRFEVAERRTFLYYLVEFIRNQHAKRANEELTQISQTDALTGLANRRAFEEALDRAVAMSKEEGRAAALLVLDIDRFKDYNDRYGHPKGDRCLESVAQAIQKASGNNSASRIGGEEFAVVLPDAGFEKAFAVAQSIRAAVRNLKIPHEALGHGHCVTVSIGVAVRDAEHQVEASKLMLLADAALYQSKRNGRDRVEASDLYA